MLAHLPGIDRDSFALRTDSNPRLHSAAGSYALIRLSRSTISFEKRGSVGRRPLTPSAFPIAYRPLSTLPRDIRWRRERRGRTPRKGANLTAAGAQPRVRSQDSRTLDNFRFVT